MKMKNCVVHVLKVVDFRRLKKKKQELMVRYATAKLLA